MSVSLQKGQKIDLTKNNSGLKQVLIGLGWDEVKRKKGFLSALSRQDSEVDCDASVIMCKDGKITDIKDLIYYGNLKHASGAVIHTGDNLTGAGDGDDEQIIIDLTEVPQEYDKLVFVVNIYKGEERKQHFGMIENAFIRIADMDKNAELCKYNLSENYDNMYAIIFGELYRHNSEWKFSAIGQPTQDKGINEVLSRYK